MIVYAENEPAIPERFLWICYENIIHSSYLFSYLLFASNVEAKNPTAVSSNAFCATISP